MIRRRVRPWFGVSGLLAGVLAGLPVVAGAGVVSSVEQQQETSTARTTGSAQGSTQNVADPQTNSTVRTGGDKRTGRALLEAGTFLTFSTLNYWRKYSDFIEDWQFGLNWKDQRRKLFTSEGHRLDSNTMQLNWTHAAAGAIYYNWARTNRLSAGESTLVAAGASVVWEFVSEWREISAINDHVFTVAGGLAIGEPLFQIGHYYRNRPGVTNRIAETLSNPILAANDLLDGSTRPPRVPVDTDHDFHLSLGGRSGVLTADDRRPSVGAAELAMRVITLPGYGEPGSGRGFADRVIDSGIRFGLDAGSGSAGEFALRTRTTLFGWWWKQVRLDGEGRRHGYDVWLGCGTAWDVWRKSPVVDYDGKELGMTEKWFPREQPTRYADKSSFVHLPGPTLALTRYDGRLWTRLDLHATVDFGMVNALAFNRYSATHPIAGVKTTLHNWGYYYALGGTAAGSLEVRYGPVRASAGLEYQRVGSIEGLDRYQSDITDDSHLKDSRLSYGVGLSVQVPGTPVFATAGAERLSRWGQFHDVTERRHETRIGYGLGVRF